MGAKMLIVDDEQPLAHHLRDVFLVEFPGSIVDVAYSGEEALSRLAEGGYDLILADVRMPGLNGLQLIQGIRYLDGGIPVVLMTGYGSQLIRQEAARLSVTHYMEKPFDVCGLLVRVRELLEDRAH